MPYIERAITDVLRRRVVTSKALLITGARQVGKSTLVRHAFPEYGRANFDDRLVRLQAREEPRLFFMNNPRPLFIDEVQKEPSVLEEIKLVVDESEERGQLLLSGSQKLELMRGVSESLAGRVSVVELAGLSLHSNEGLDHSLSIFYYRGKDRRAAGDSEIDLVIEEDGVLYPVEIKMTGNPKASMGATNTVLDRPPDKRRGMGVVLCLVERKTYLRDNLVALPIEYV